MWIFPLAAALIGLAFAVMVGWRFVRRHRPYLAAWAVALLMFAAASFAAFLGILSGWNSPEYRAYWLLGAVLNVPFLAYGELLLLVRDRRVRAVLFLVVVFGTAYAFNVVRTADVNVAALGQHRLPLGKDVFFVGYHLEGTCVHGLKCFPLRNPMAYRLAQYYSYPAYVILVAGAVWSAFRMRRKPELRNRFLGTLGIAVGATIVAIGSGVGAGLDVVPVFSVDLALGIAVMFWGFLRASSAPRQPA
ncbi:MAG TPA: hypothetical protein VGB19_08525 [Actinomycetota bacterium]